MNAALPEWFFRVMKNLELLDVISGKMRLCRGYISLFLGSEGGSGGPQLCDSGSLGMGEIDL